MTRSPKSLSFILCVNMDICTESHRNLSNSCSWHLAKNHVKFQPNGGPEGNVGGSPKSVGFILREPLRSFQRFIVIHKSISAWTKLIDRLAKPLAWLKICELQEIMQFWQHQPLWCAHIANRQAWSYVLSESQQHLLITKGMLILTIAHIKHTQSGHLPHTQQITSYLSILFCNPSHRSLTANK